MAERDGLRLRAWRLGLLAFRRLARVLEGLRLLASAVRLAWILLRDWLSPHPRLRVSPPPVGARQAAVAWGIWFRPA